MKSPENNVNDAPGIKNWWQDLNPYITLRFFKLEEETWSGENIKTVNDLSAAIKAITGAYGANAGTYDPGAKKENKLFAGMGELIFPVNTTTLQSVPVKDIQANQLSAEHFCMITTWFRVKSFPAWTKSAPADFQDVRHHLIILAIQPPFVGVTCTHPETNTSLNTLFNTGRVKSIKIPAPLYPVNAKNIENAFVKEEAYQLWLKGNHRSIETKPDKKTLEGIDLRLAIDPFADQTYNYTAIVSKLDPTNSGNTPVILEEKGKEISRIGYSRSTQTIWLTKAKGILEFGQTFSLLRKMIMKASKLSPADLRKIVAGRGGLETLSESVSGNYVSEATVPFELTMILQDIHPDMVDKTEAAINEENWKIKGRLEINKKIEVEYGQDFISIPVNAIFENRTIGCFVIEVRKSTEGTLAIAIKDWENKGGPEDEDEFEKLDRMISLKTPDHAFNIRFDSGYVLTGNNLYRQQYTDLLFDQWIPVKLKKVRVNKKLVDFDASLEKPREWNKFSSRKKLCNKITTGDSLFSRVANDIPALVKPARGVSWYLLCHDQANEIADFIYIEPDSRRIELIHVKGANTSSDTREISIDAFQVVCAQAIKNLRHLNMNELSSRFTDREKKEAGQFMTSSNKQAVIDHDCSLFIDELEKMKAGLPLLQKKVIIFQPHISTRYWKNSVLNSYKQLANPAEDSVLRKAFMLSTLLIETEIACKKQGAKFEVWTEK